MSAARPLAGLRNPEELVVTYVHRVAASAISIRLLHDPYDRLPSKCPILVFIA
jgi:hypothetical protein